MDQRIFYAAGNSNALDITVRELEMRGAVFAKEPSKTVTHLLLPVPCREDVSEVMKELSLDVTVFGGDLSRPELAGYRCRDLLEDALYLAKNAQITAHCAVSIAADHLPVILEGCPVLVIGWGRIGKCLASLLSRCGAEVSVAARKEADRAMIAALGYDAEDTNALGFILKRYRAIFNTVPSPVLTPEQVAYCRPDCLKLELASSPGIAGDGVICARGLPARYAPESSGKLIARSILRICAQKEDRI